MVKIIKADFGFSKTAFDDFIKIMIPEAEGVKFSAVTKVESEEKIEIEIEGNGKRNAMDCYKLKQASWRVITIFECQLKIKKQEKTLSSSVKKLCQD